MPNAKQVILEGLERADYVAPYLHGDRFIPASRGGNPFIDDAGSFTTRCFKTEHSFFVQVDSTTMTFATTIETLQADAPIWNKWTTGTYPHDHSAFLELGKVGRTIVSPIPTVATHCEIAWKSPLIGTTYKDWSEVI